MNHRNQRQIIQAKRMREDAEDTPVAELLEQLARDERDRYRRQEQLVEDTLKEVKY